MQAPIIAVYLMSLIGVMWPRPIRWRLLPIATTAAAVASLLTHVVVARAFRAYEPEEIWLLLTLAAPFVAFAARLLASARRGS